MKNEISTRKLAANRMNALQSTGPKTEEGKRAVRSNSLKHGFFSKEIVLQKGDGRESVAEFNRMRESLLADLQPDGELQRLVADLIVAHSWRLRRIYLYETGALRLRLDTAQQDQETQRLNNLRWDLATLSDGSSRNTMLRQSSTGICFLIGLLGTAHEELKKNGLVTHITHEALLKNFDDGNDSIGSRCSAFFRRATLNVVLAESDAKSSDGNSEDNEAKQQLLGALTIEIQALNSNLGEVLEREQLRSEAHIAILYLPSEELAERILRHGTAIERQLFHAVAELGRLKRERPGK